MQKKVGYVRKDLIVMMYRNVVFSINISIKIRTRQGYDFLLVAWADPPLWARWASSQALAETFTYLSLTRLLSDLTSYDDYFQT